MKFHVRIAIIVISSCLVIFCVKIYIMFAMSDHHKWIMDFQEKSEFIALRGSLVGSQQHLKQHHLKLWSADFHISPVADLKHTLGKNMKCSVVY